MARAAARAVVGVRGADAAKLLQGLATNNVQAWMDAASPDALATAFLNTKGRVIADCVLWRHGDGVLVDCAEAQAAALLRHLKTYKLRSDATPRREPELRVATFAAAAAAAGGARCCV